MQERGSDAGRLSRAALDARAFNKGKGRFLAVGALLCVVAAAAFVWFVLDEQPDPYRTLGKHVNGLKSRHFDAFWGCALPGKQLSEIKSDTDLRGEIEVRAVAGARYGADLRACAASLAELSVNLKALLPPHDAQPFVRDMAEGARKMEVSVIAFSDYLDASEAEHEGANRARASDVLVRGWYEFRKAHADLNLLLRTHLGR